MKTYIIGLIALSLTACTSVHQSTVKVNMNRHLSQEERMERIEAKMESHGKEM